MADSVANLLLRIAGDGDDAERTMEQLAAGLAALGAMEAEPGVQLEGDETTMAAIAGLIAAVETLDRTDADIDVNVDKDGAARATMAELVQGMLGIGPAAEEAGGGLGHVGARFLGFSFQLNKFTGALLALGYTAVGTLVAALGAVLASATLAVGGLLALATAALGLAAIFGVFLVGAIARFKDQMDVAGSAANELKKAVGPLKDAFANAMGPGADAVFRGLTVGIRNIIPLVNSLKPAFTAVGEAMAAGIVVFSEALVELGPEIGKLVTQGAPAFFLMAEAAGPLLGILVDIANAAMPYLLAILEDIGKQFREWRGFTSNSQALSGIIGEMMIHLKLWWNLIKAIGGAWLAFTAAAAPAGGALVGWITKGVQALTAWMKSTEGKNTLKSFFDDVIPAAAAFIGFLLRLIRIFFQLVQVAAPALEALFNGLNFLLDIISFLIQKGMGLLQFFAELAVFLLGAGKAVTALRFVLTHLRTAFGAVAEIIGAIAKGGAAAWGSFVKQLEKGADVARTVILAAFSAITGALTIAAGLIAEGAGFITGIWDGMKDAATAVFNAIKSVIEGAVDGTIGGIKSAWNGAKGAIEAIWNGIKSTATSIWNGIKGAIDGAVDGAASAVRTTLGSGGLSGWLSSLWNGIRSTANSAWDVVKDHIVDPIKGAVSAVKNALGEDGLRGWLGSLWSGIKSAANSAWDVVKDHIVDPIKGAVSAAKGALGEDGLRGWLVSVWSGIKETAGKAWGEIKDKIIDPVKDALAFIKGLAGDFFSAGKSLMTSLKNGVMSLVDEVYDAVKGAVNKVKGLLPGSEPKDRTSPLRGLPKAGAAIMENLALGVTRRAPLLLNTLRAELTSVPSLAMAPLTPGAVNPTTTTNSQIHRHYHIPPGPSGGMEPMFAASQLDGLLRSEGVLG